MSKESDNQSRRAFLKVGTVAAASSILAIRTSGATDTKKLNAKTGGSPFDDCDCEVSGYTDITAKRISSRFNILGTDAINVREYCPDGADITDALNCAISYLSNGGAASSGGIILIPRGFWTSDGGHELTDAITIEGIGSTTHENNFGTQIKMNTGGGSFMFQINPTVDRTNIGLKNLVIDLENAPLAVGLLMTNTNGGGSIYNTALENVDFAYGAWGIRVNNTTTLQFECILNRFERVTFVGCETAFSCNTINGGYTFDNCYFNVPNGGTALDCETIGNLSLNHCLFVGAATANSNATVLKTTGAYNNISFFDCQDEGCEFVYQNGTNHYPEVPIVFRNCLVQSKFKYSAIGSLIFDSCFINVTDRGNTSITHYEKALIYEDPETQPAPPASPIVLPYVRVYLKGVNNIYVAPMHTGILSDFKNPLSRILYEADNPGDTFIAPAPPTPTTSFPGYYITNSSRGVVIIPSGFQTVVVYNNLAHPNCIILTQLMSYSAAGAQVREVIRNTDYFTINLTQIAAANLSVAFKIENYKLT